MVIRQPKEKDLEKILELLTRSITVAFLDEGLAKLHNDIVNEIIIKYKLIYKHINTNNNDHLFLVALEDEKIIGLISYGPVNNIISNNIEREIKAKMLGSIYIHPRYQNRKVASSLIKKMIEILLDKGINEFVLDCGFSKAQKVWAYKFGKPYLVLKNYWSSGSDHYIWYCTDIEQYL